MTEKIKLAFKGEKGAYSHLACLETFPNVEVVACSTLKKPSKWQAIIHNTR